MDIILLGRYFFVIQESSLVPLGPELVSVCQVYYISEFNIPHGITVYDCY